MASLVQSVESPVEQVECAACSMCSKRKTCAKWLLARSVIALLELCLRRLKETFGL